MHLIDSHCHFSPSLDISEIDSQLQRAAEVGVQEIIGVGTDPDDWSSYHSLATKRKNLHWTCGLHPCHVEEDWEKALEKMKSTLRESTTPPCAIGEIGLDFTRLPKNDRERQIHHQKQAFRKQLHIAQEVDLPVIIHSRNAVLECLTVLKEEEFPSAKAVFHCFSEGPDIAQILLELGVCLSFTGILTFNSAENVRESALLAGLDRILLETDSPWLSPVPFRGQKNEPSRVRTIAEYCATLFSCSLEEVAERTTKNTKNFFGI